MRNFSLHKLIIIAVILALLVFAVCKFAGCFKSEEEKRLDAAIAADPNFKDYTANSEQVRLRGFFIDNEKSNDETVYTYLVFELKGPATENNAVAASTISSKGSASLVRLVTLDDETDASDCLSAESAAAFEQVGILAACYTFNNSVEGVKLESGTGANSILVVAACTFSRNDIANAKNVSVWFDIVDGLKNDGSGSHWPASDGNNELTIGAQQGTLSYENVIFTFPASLATNIERESDIFARFQK